MGAINLEKVTAGSEVSKNVQEEKLFRGAKKKSLLGMLTSGTTTLKDKVLTSGSSSPIKEITNLEGKLMKGGKVQFRYIDKCQDDGVTGDETLTGTGETLDEYTQYLTLELYRKAVRVDSLSAEFAIDNLEEEHKTALERWGTEKIDKNIIDAFTLAPTSIFYSVGGEIQAPSASASAVVEAITAADTITPQLLQYLSTYGVTGGTNADRRFKKLTPISDKGMDVKYALLVHPHATYDLKRNSEYRQECRERANLAGSESEKTFWTNAIAIVDGVVIFTHEDMPLQQNSSGIWVSKGVLTGAASLAMAWGRRPYTTEESRDHGKIKEVGWNMVSKAQKITFNDIDMNSIGVYVAQTDINGTVA